jgi:hypothetical protein
LAQIVLDQVDKVHQGGVTALDDLNLDVRAADASSRTNWQVPARSRRAAHDNGQRPHRSREFRPPQPAHPAADLSKERIRRRPVLGGLNEYERAA